MVRVVKKPDERRKEIVQAAKSLFQSKEYEKTTMQDLMDSLNIAKGTIYHYFSSKEELLEAVVEDLVDEELQRKKTMLASPRCRDLDALEKIRLLSTTDTMADDNEKILKHLHHPGNTRLHASLLGRYLTRLAPIYADLIEQGCRQGLFTTDYPLECAEFILAGIQFLTDVGFYPWDASQLSRRAKAFPALIEAQLSAPEGAFNFLVE